MQIQEMLLMCSNERTINTMKIIMLISLLSAVILNVQSAKILAVFPTPSISHQVVFRPLIHELVRRGHEVVLITADPAFKEGERPANLTEIDMHDVAYKPRKKYIPDEYEDSMKPTLNYNIRKLSEMFTIIFMNIMEQQLTSEPIQKLINNETQRFDLLFVEAYLRPALVFTHIFKAPVIQFSSFGFHAFNMDVIGTPMHPILYPNCFSRKIINLTLYERMTEYYNFAVARYVMYSYENKENELLRRTVGPGIPTISELAKNVDMLFVNVHPLWQFNIPVPPNVIYLGAFHIQPQKELPKDLKTYLDSSKNGLIYMSFGTNVDATMLPPGSIEVFVKVFSELPYNVLWKWYTEDVPGLPKNVKISKWFPQRDLLMHSNIKLFITQGGLQSTDETILAGVPAVGIPMIGDQWYNVDLYVKHGIGVRLDIEMLDAEKFRNAINTVINEKSYKENIIKLRNIMYDQPQSPLERAVWWTEYVLRHGGARHLRSPAANLPWTQYYEIELIAYLLAFLVVLVVVTVLFVYFVTTFVLTLINSPKKIKVN